MVIVFAVSVIVTTPVFTPTAPAASTAAEPAEPFVVRAIVGAVPVPLTVIFEPPTAESVKITVSEPAPPTAPVDQPVNSPFNKLAKAVANCCPVSPSPPVGAVNVMPASVTVSPALMPLN